MSQNFNQARKAKSDEFHTQLSDIENELRYYRQHFKGKVIYCNCDNPHISNFFHYFHHNFRSLGLKKLITTCYRNPNLFSQSCCEQAIKLEYDGFQNGNDVPKIQDIGITHLNGDGDFRSQECIDILRQADIVVTNPPFSLFREYVAQLMEYGKKFLILGNINAVTYRDFFPLIKDNRVWLGPGIKSGDRTFAVPDHYPLEAANAWIDEDGKKFIKVKGVRWFTNVDFPQRHETLALHCRYNPVDYPHFDNYDAINVNVTKNIPVDYEAVMGVPITFLDKWNPEQFRILGITERRNDSGLKTRIYTRGDGPGYSDLNRRGVVKINGRLKSIYARVLVIKLHNCQVENPNLARINTGAENVKTGF